MRNISTRMKVVLLGWILAVLCLLIHNFSSAELLETAYGSGLFPVIRIVLDYSFGILPFSGTLLLVVALISRLAYLLLGKVRTTWTGSALLVFGWIGWILASFYILWGFNYSRPGVQERVFAQGQRFTATELFAFAEDHLDTVNSLRLALATRTMEPSVDRQAIRDSAYTLAASLGYEVPGHRLRLREWSDFGFLLRIGTAGFYNPFTGECNIDGGLHPLQKPYVIAHEFFHGLGVTDEGECNFLAYLICKQSSDPYVRYSGELAVWRYLRSALYRTDAEQFSLTAAKSDSLVHADLTDIRNQMLKYPDIAPRARDQIYHAYLRSNKIEDGMASYGRVVGLVMMWKALQDSNGS